MKKKTTAIVPWSTKNDIPDIPSLPTPPVLVVEEAQREISEAEKELDQLYKEENALGTRKESLREKKKQAEAKIARAFGDIALVNIDALLALTPFHVFATCTDKNPSELYDGRDRICSRCVLLRAQRERWWDSEFEVKVSVQRVDGND